MRIVGCIIKSVLLLPNYYGVVHRGVRNYRFSKLQKTGDVLCWKGFTSTSQDEKVAQMFKTRIGTIFHINSLTGRNLTIYSIRY